MEAWLLDTSFASSYLDETSDRHRRAKEWLESQDPEDSIVVSAITLGEIEFGAALYEKAFGIPLEGVKKVIETLRSGDHRVEPITHHTAFAYADIKSAVAKYIFGDNLRQRVGRKKLGRSETWKSDLNAASLHIDENDLWICACALEHNYAVVSFDRDVDIARAAYPALRAVKLA